MNITIEQTAKAFKEWGRRVAAEEFHPMKRTEENKDEYAGKQAKYFLEILEEQASH